MTLADRIMQVAMAHPPPGREQWAQAMQAEYEQLNGDKLSWAFGCWTTMFGWRMRSEALYAVIMVAVTCLWILGIFDDPVINLTPRELAYGGLIQPYLAAMLLVNIALSTFRPDRVVATALTMIAFSQIGCVWDYYQAQQAFPLLADGPIHPYNSYYFVAIFAQVGVCFVGAKIGQWVNARGIQFLARAEPDGPGLM